MTAERQTCLKMVKMNTPTLSDCPQWVWSTETQYVPSPNSSKSAMDPTAQAQSIWPNYHIYQPRFAWNQGSHFPSKKLPFGGPKTRVFGRELNCTGIHAWPTNHQNSPSWVQPPWYFWLPLLLLLSTRENEMPVRFVKWRKVSDVSNAALEVHFG